MSRPWLGMWSTVILAGCAASLGGSVKMAAGTDWARAVLDVAARMVKITVDAIRICSSLSQGAFPEEVAEHGFSSDDISGVDGGFDFFRGEPAGRDALVIHGRGDASGEAGGEKDGHLLSEEAGAGEKCDELFPVLRVIAGFLFQLALGGLKRLLAWIHRAGRQFPQKALGRQTILPDQQNALAIVNGHHDGRAAMVHDGALDFEAVGVDGMIYSHGK